MSIIISIIIIIMIIILLLLLLSCLPMSLHNDSNGLARIEISLKLFNIIKFMTMKFVMVMVKNGKCFHLMFNNELTGSVLLSTWTDDICCRIAVHSLSFTHNSSVHGAGLNTSVPL